MRPSRLLQLPPTLSLSFPSQRPAALLMGCAALLALTACSDPDMRRFGASGTFNTTSAAQDATAHRPAADDRGIISYPNYQVAVARDGDTVSSVAQRIGVDADTLASYNALTTVTRLRRGEILALPGRVSEPVASSSDMMSSAPLDAGGNMSSGSGDQVDITALASSAIDRAATTQPSRSTPAATAAPARKTLTQPAASEPARHRVQRGETAFTIARKYNVTPAALAEWNGLGADMSVREGQYLMIPPSSGAATPSAAAAPTPAPVAPPEPAPSTEAAAPAAAPAPAAKSQLLMPVQGSIIRPYVKKKNDGIDISAPAGTAVKAADAGTVAAITKDTEQVPIVVIRHASGLLTVYANLDSISVKKGETVKRGQAIAKLRGGSDNYLHFEVRKGFDSVDPVPYVE